MKTLIISVVLVITTNTLSAQNTDRAVFNTKGLFLNVSVTGVAWEFEDSGLDAESGRGGGVRLGYNFTPQFGLSASLDIANIDPEVSNSYLLGHFDLSSHIIFLPEKTRFRPYLKASYLGLATNSENIEASGTGYSGGVGIYIALIKKLGLDISYTESRINLTEVKIDSQTFEIDQNAHSGRFFIGLTRYF